MPNSSMIIIFLLSLIETTIGYYCSCYCSNDYYGTAYTSICSSHSCQSACHIRYCQSFSSTIGYCSSSDSDENDGTGLSKGAIAGIVIGSLAGLALLIGIIVLIIHYSRRKQTPTKTIEQPQQRQGTYNATIAYPSYSYVPDPYQQPLSYQNGTYTQRF